MPERINKVNELIKQEVSKLVEKEVSLENTLVTVSSVETTPDLHYANILVSVFPSDKRETAFKELEKSAPQIQKLLNKKIKMRYVPRISFKIDYSAENVERVERLLREDI